VAKDVNHCAFSLLQTVTCVGNRTVNQVSGHLGKPNQTKLSHLWPESRLD
jgi:hypothetical protein